MVSKIEVGKHLAGAVNISVAPKRFSTSLIEKKLQR